MNVSTLIKLEETARKNGFTSATAAINYAVECKNASNGLETPTNGNSEDAIRQLWDDMKANSYGNESPFMVRISFGQFSAAIARWLGRYRLELKNALQGQQTPNKAMSTSRSMVKSWIDDMCS